MPAAVLAGTGHTLGRVRPARFLPADRPVQRLARCLAGLFVFGLGITLMLRAELGAAPWDVFHTGVAERLDLSVGTVLVATGLALLVLWVPLRVRPGVGTLLNAVLIGVVVDLTYALVGQPGHLAARAALLVGGVALVGVGSGAYIGAGLGPGPRDGVMTGLARRRVAGRPITIRVARTAIELTALLAGVALGGAIGVGTLVFALGIGPVVHAVLPRLAMDPDDAAHPTGRGR